MKRYLTAALFCALSLSGPLAHADIIDDAIGNIQQAINDAYNPASDREDSDDRGWDDRRSTSQSSQQYHDRRRQLDDRQRQLDRERQQLSDEEQRLEDDDDR